MPTYPITKTYRGGFYNNKVVNGVNDRVYNAEDVRKPYDVIYSDGIKPDADGTVGSQLQVIPNSGMQITVLPGFGKLGGAWFENYSNYNITLDDPIADTRYDCVIIRNDDNDSVREPSIYIKSLQAIPTSNILVRDNNIYEICIAYIKVTSSTTEITESDIVDTRVEGKLCNVMSGVGATVVRTYRNTYYSEEVNQFVIPIGIPQFDRTRDTLTVLIEGRIAQNYMVLDNETVVLDIPLPLKNTRIDFEVIKNVNAAGAETVIQEVASLTQQMTATNKKLENHYYCNGLTDNVNVSKIVNDFLSGGSNYDNMRLMIHGNFGATNPVTGEGTTDSHYVWIRAGLGSEANRKVFLDFTDCSQISINCDEDSYNIIFFGLQANISGVNIIATGGARILMFSSAARTFVNAENCRFWITSQSGYIARGGDFKNCRCSVTTTVESSYCFNVLTGGLLRLYGGEYYSYSVGSNFSTIVYVNSGQTSAIVNTYSINCPTVTRSGYNQTYAINCLTGDACCSFTDTITELQIVADGQNIRGTISQSRPGLN